MILPLTFRIREPDVKIPKERRGDFVEFDEGGVAAWAGVVAESELRGVKGREVSEWSDRRERGEGRGEGGWDSIETDRWMNNKFE